MEVPSTTGTRGNSPEASRRSDRTTRDCGQNVRTSSLRRKMVRGVPLRASTRSICCAPSQACQMRELAIAPEAASTTKVPAYGRAQGALCMRSIHCKILRSAGAGAASVAEETTPSADETPADTESPVTHRAATTPCLNCCGGAFNQTHKTPGELITQSHHASKPLPAQRLGVSKVALRKNPAGICNADVLPNCLCAASNSSRRGPRIPPCAPPSASATATTGAPELGPFAPDSGEMASWAPPVAPGAPLPCNVAREVQPIAATAARDAKPATIFQRKTDALAASAIAGATTSTRGTAAAAGRTTGPSLASSSRNRAMKFGLAGCARSEERNTSPTKWQSCQVAWPSACAA